jgi:hypothetical protein
MKTNADKESALASRQQLLARRQLLRFICANEAKRKAARLMARGELQSGR